MRKLTIALAGAVGIATLLLSKFLTVRAIRPPLGIPLFFHIKHENPYPSTLGKVSQIYSSIQSVNLSGNNIGLNPQCVADWETQLSYYSECGTTPVMLNVLTSDNATRLTLEQIAQASAVCNVKYYRFHEALSYFQPFPTAYVQSVLALAKSKGIPVFWNEWDVNQYQNLAGIITGYEDTVIASFGTNNNWLEPVAGYQLLQPFLRKGASVQSWYWWERHGRVNGTELEMPASLMVQHTHEAVNAGCEVVQYEPYGYFFNNAVPNGSLSAVLATL